MSEIEELKKKISYLENENIVMYSALVEASSLGGVAALRCKVELQRIAREDNAQQSVQSGDCPSCAGSGKKEVGGMLLTCLACDGTGNRR